MRTQIRSPRPRGRAAIVAALITVGVLVAVGVGHAEPAAPDERSSSTAAEPGKDGSGADKGEGKAAGKPDGEGTVCADGKRDDNAADGVCTRDGQAKDGQAKDGQAKDGQAKDGQAKDGQAKDDKAKDDKAKDDKAKDGKDKPAEDPNLVKGTPCTKTADACVDLVGKKAWLIDADGKVSRGPVQIAHGGPGNPTPPGTFQVQWKNKDHRSMEFDNAPMPFAVFFTDGGIAFHQGDLNSNSHGCVRLALADAEAFFNVLQVDDEVQVR